MDFERQMLLRNIEQTHTLQVSPTVARSLNQLRQSCL